LFSGTDSAGFPPVTQQQDTSEARKKQRGKKKRRGAGNNKKGKRPDRSGRRETAGGAGRRRPGSPCAEGENRPGRRFSFPSKYDILSRNDPARGKRFFFSGAEEGQEANDNP
jgi:hypothetical protein